MEDSSIEDEMYHIKMNGISFQKSHQNLRKPSFYLLALVLQVENAIIVLSFNPRGLDGKQSESPSCCTTPLESPTVCGKYQSIPTLLASIIA